jgi:hypothetical protein
MTKKKKKQANPRSHARLASILKRARHWNEHTRAVAPLPPRQRFFFSNRRCLPPAGIETHAAHHRATPGGVGRRSPTGRFLCRVCEDAASRRLPTLGPASSVAIILFYLVAADWGGQVLLNVDTCICTAAAATYQGPGTDASAGVCCYNASNVWLMCALC